MIILRQHEQQLEFPIGIQPRRVQNMRSVRILLVEDHADQRVPLAEILRDEGYEVVEATCAADAVAEFARQPFGIVLLDYRLPDQNAPWVVQQMRAIDPSCPIVFVTATGPLEIHPDRGGDFTYEREADELGIAAFFEKPVDVDQLLAVIRAA